MHQNYNRAQSLMRGAQAQSEVKRTDMHTRPSQKPGVRLSDVAALLQPGANEEFHKAGKLPPRIHVNQERDCLELGGDVLFTRAEIANDSYRANAHARLRAAALKDTGL